MRRLYIILGYYPFLLRPSFYGQSQVFFSLHTVAQSRKKIFWLTVEVLTDRRGASSEVDIDVLFYKIFLVFPKFNGSPSSASQKFFSASLQPQLSALKKILWLALLNRIIAPNTN